MEDNEIIDPSGRENVRPVKMDSFGESLEAVVPLEDGWIGMYRNNRYKGAIAKAKLKEAEVKLSKRLEAWGLLLDTELEKHRHRLQTDLKAEIEFQNSVMIDVMASTGVTNLEKRGKLLGDSGKAYLKARAEWIEAQLPDEIIKENEALFLSDRKILIRTVFGDAANEIIDD